MIRFSMKHSISMLLSAFLWLPTFQAIAQSTGESPQSEPVPERIPVWRCETPAGTYTVAIRSIAAVSQSEYVVDGAVRVTEVNIDTTGNLVPRFYYLEPVVSDSHPGTGQAAIEKAREIFEKAADRAGASAVWNQVVKSYPTSTHAHTVEFRVDSMATLNRIFESVDASFRMQKPGKVNLRD